MLSILDRIGHLLRHLDFYADQLDVIYPGPDRSFIASSKLLCRPVDVIYLGPDKSFIASSGLLCLPCTMRKMDKNMCKYRVILYW